MSPAAMAARVGDVTEHGGAISPPGAVTVLIEGMPAARVSDLHVCPMVTGTVPHVGGPILPPGAPTVLIEGLAAARVTDWLTCEGPIDVIKVGASRTQIGDPVAAPPAPPGASPGGSGEGSIIWYYQWVTVYEAGLLVVWASDALVVVAVAAGLYGALVYGVAVAVVVYPFVSRSTEIPFWPTSKPEASGFAANSQLIHENIYQEGVRDDAEMFFLR